MSRITLNCAMLLRTLFGTLLAGLVSCCDYSESVCGAIGPGDITIGVLSPCHSKVQNLGGRIRPEKFNCTGFDLQSFVQILAVIHTIDTINDSGFLPGIRLGYLVCDTCSDAIKGIQGLFLVPQISATSSAKTLDDKLRYPSFLRTIPSDVHQTHALVELIAHFKWNWVGVVSGDDDYGRAALSDFLQYAEDAGVCAAFNEVIPHYLDHPAGVRRIAEVATLIQSSKAQVVLLILKGELVERLFKLMISRRISRTWIASDSWSMYQPVATMTGINRIGDVFGIRFITGPNPGFEDFLTNLSPGPEPVNRFIEEYKDLRFGCSPEIQRHQDCLDSRPAEQCPLPDSLKLKSKVACEQPDPQKANDDFLAHAVDLRQMYAHRVATWSIAYALRSLLKCNKTICTGERDLESSQLLQEIKNVNFTLDNRQFYFDKSSFATGYELIIWLSKANGRRFKVIGEYDVTKHTLAIVEESIEWQNPNKTIPESRCSESCPPGTFQKISMIFCCFNCSECEEGTYTNVSDRSNCRTCPNGTWSLRGWKKCQQRTEGFFTWDDPFAISLLVVTGIGLILLFSICIIFLNSRHSVIFKVAVEVEVSNQTMVIVLQCNEGSNWGFGLMLSYIALLASICFLLALKGRKVPQRFNDTGYIIFSMGSFGTSGSFRRGRILLPGTEDASPGERQSAETRDFSGSTDGDTKERKPTDPAQSSQREPLSSSQKQRTCVPDLPQEVALLDISGTTSNTPVAQGKQKPLEKDMTDKRLAKKPKKEKTKISRGVKPVKKEKAKKNILSEQKVDFPEPLVKAHQAAYGFLNPSLGKYDVLLGLLEQATQTQISVQPMVTFMLLRYEEINRGLEAMAYEGENLLKENGEHLAWPSPTKKPSSSYPLKPGSISVDPPPDLLQQLLQYTTQRMRTVCQTVGEIGDSALEEAVEYFTSLSELLEEKLQVRRATNARLMQLLAQIETASLRKPGPEDSALFSEDSGIGAESESLAGSELRLRRESCESTGTNTTTSSSPTGCSTITRHWPSSQKLASKNSLSGSLTSIDSTCTIMAKELNDTESIMGSTSLDDGEEDDIDNVGDADLDDKDMVVRRRANSSPIDLSQRPRRLPPKRIENPRNVEMTLKMKDAISGRIKFVPSHNAISKITCSPKSSRQQWTEDDEEQSNKRPQTAAPIRRVAAPKSQVPRQQRSQSAESLRSKGEDPTLLELERTQKVLNQRLERMIKGKAGSNTRTVPSKLNQGHSPAQSPAVSRKHTPSVKSSKAQPSKEMAGLITHPNRQQEPNSVNEDMEKIAVKTSKGPIKATPPPSPPSSPRPSSAFSRGRNSVKKLIDTFSQSREQYEGTHILGPLKGVRKCGVPVMPGLGNVDSVLSTGITSCRDESTSSDKMDDLDLDNLPPPPLEVLMDNSFEGAHCLATSSLDNGATKRAKSPIAKRAVVSRLKASVQSVTVLPCKGNLPLLMKPDPRDASLTEDESEKALAASAQKQTRKNIGLQHYSKLRSEDSSMIHLNPVPSQCKAVASLGEQDNRSQPDPEFKIAASPVPQTLVGKSQQSVTTPLSRVRMLPSTPLVQSIVQQRFTSPHSSRRQPTPPSSTSPPVIRKLPTPPPIHRRLPSTPVTRQNVSNPASSYPFKAPSPPASPKVQRWSRASSSSGSNDSYTSRLTSNARSVFCPASPSLFEAQPYSVPQPPQAWTSTGGSILPHPYGSHGQVPLSLRGPRPFIRRCHSDQRQSLSLPSRSAGNVSVTYGSEPSINTQGVPRVRVVSRGPACGLEGQLDLLLLDLLLLDLLLLAEDGLVPLQPLWHEAGHCMAQDDGLPGPLQDFDPGHHRPGGSRVLGVLHQDRDLGVLYLLSLSIVTTLGRTWEQSESFTSFRKTLMPTGWQTGPGSLLVRDIPSQRR
ncbi:hypothetical protein NHX12_004049 [Muraenolepis orangiensis]|uniref:G-protein coupled receptors family 3 profile domain-containing protein n=1 Tax=Muraenolepis orangiensis TaxID=630683 RepID=A0A9Q0DUP0_9TELE|nr:hypothetical protein NHX12_004049 [Muraenolepis orangiensis]